MLYNTWGDQYLLLHKPICDIKGTWVTFSAPISEEVAEEIVATAFESGINVFDLSDGYCGPRAELSLGRILRQRRWKRSSYVVITKIYWSYRYSLPCLRFSFKPLLRGNHIHSVMFVSLESSTIQVVMEFLHFGGKEESIHSRH